MKKYLMIIYSLCLLISATYSADTEHTFYLEKKHCKSCSHCHYERYDYCESCNHYHNKKCDIKYMDKSAIKGMLVFDYKESGIADSNVSSYEEIQLFKDVLEKIDTRLKEINRHGHEFSIKMDFSENYIGNYSIKELREFIEKNEALKNHLVSLNFRSTNITSLCFFDIEKILNECSKVKIDISFNNILLKEFKQKFVGRFERVLFKY
jgi:hypothetical protein